MSLFSGAAAHIKASMKDGSVVLDTGFKLEAVALQASFKGALKTIDLGIFQVNEATFEGDLNGFALGGTAVAGIEVSAIRWKGKVGAGISLGAGGRGQVVIDVQVAPRVIRAAEHVQ